MTTLLLVALVLALLVLRQPLPVILLVIAGAVQLIWGRGQLTTSSRTCGSAWTRS